MSYRRSLTGLAIEPQLDWKLTISTGPSWMSDKSRRSHGGAAQSTRTSLSSSGHAHLFGVRKRQALKDHAGGVGEGLAANGSDPENSCMELITRSVHAAAGGCVWKVAIA